jgi:LCP family protein required for cell wall assembly
VPTPADPWGPTVSGGRRRRGRRVAGALLAVVVVLPLLYAAAVGFVATSAIARTPVANLEGGPGPMHVLVVGSDSRQGLTEEERIALATGSAGGERTDTIFVLSVDGGDVGLLAFPRDLYVQRCDGSTGRINAAIQLGGADCLVQTVSELSGLAINHFVSVNFLGFRDIVEAVGGVEVCLDRPISDADAGIDLPAGCQRLGGADALRPGPQDRQRSGTDPTPAGLPAGAHRRDAVGGHAGRPGCDVAHRFRDRVGAHR